MAPRRDSGAGAEAELPEYAGHYLLESRLGSGGMGVVHLARSTSGLKLAVKVVHAEFAKNPEFRSRFQQEVSAARRVSGAFTAPVVDADHDAERPWMATLFIPGPTLSEEVKRNGPLPPEKLRRLMAGLAEALRDIHRVGVVHRDLKPSNVLLAEDGPKVIDFGISRPKDSELRTETGKLIGTPPFMAPEQFRRPREVGPAADIFALGSVLVHAATGRGPFDSDSPYIVAYQVVHDEPELTGVPDNLAPLVRRCLAKEPEERPTPDELMRELRSVAASYDTQAFVPGTRVPDGDTEPSVVPEVPVEEPARPVRRVRGKALLAGAVVAVLAGGGLAGLQLIDGGGTAGPRPTASTTASFAPWATKPAADGSESIPRCTHASGRLLCAQRGLVSALDANDGRVLWRHTLAAGESPGRAPVVEGGLVHVVTGSGGRAVALDPATGATRWQRDVSAYSGVFFAPGTLLLTSSDGKVTAVDGASGRDLWSKRIPGQRLPVFAAFDGDGLAYATSVSSDGARTRVTAIDPASGAVRWEARLTGGLTPVGRAGADLVFLKGGSDYGETGAVVRYSPGTQQSLKVPLDVALSQARATVTGERVYLLGYDGSLAAVDLSAGKQVWSLQTSVSRGSDLAADGTRVYFSAADGRLLSVDARAGKLVGQTTLRIGARSDEVAAALPSPQVVDGRVYAGAPDGTVFSVASGSPGD
ncbi:serine/threonine-protein kinase [Streptomyces roseirectus]|uniref:Serine/threonine-protein kinase n=1 Tax=Streptomyces roseirectus TaxID=2768066 RepID=A0A7H0IDX5_9ACTN|nr:serine/threonine-protein kinase [Streptomyces roseirectus]QNP70991.1 serine/threonine-protein kinase [Streptomyces roseirectus]